VTYPDSSLEPGLDSEPPPESCPAALCCSDWRH